jgi:hypothetical protein
MKQTTVYALKNKTSNTFIHYTESDNGKWCSIGPKEERLWVVEDEYVAQNALQKNTERDVSWFECPCWAFGWEPSDYEVVELIVKSKD